MSARVVHWKIESCDVYVGRPGPWGNPFSHKDGTLALYKTDTVEEAVKAFEVWVATSDDEKAVWMRAHMGELTGKVLGCWCKRKGDEPCHGDVLLRWANP